MESAHGMQEAPPKMEEKPEWWASPATLGLLGFGMTTILAGLSVGDWIGFGALLSMAIFFGGLGQLIAGVIALRKGNMFAGSAFVGYGAFWLSFYVLANYVLSGSPLTSGYDVAAFMFVWFLVTFTYLINAPKHGIGITLVFLTLTIAFLLLTYDWWEIGAGTPLTPMGTTLHIIGGEIILTGALAWLVATADLTNWNYGRRIIPV